ncbi:MAG: PepSY-like domain-containing protein [Cyclobacteriaceae bacterium]|nr:PepSY-like domain-containing protein [Cyclobacteriaceae bacterium]
MIKLILIFAITGFFMQAQAQDLKEIDIPMAVTAAFDKSYPTIETVDWIKSGSNFEAEYKADTLNRSVTYNSTGTLVETNMEILEADLPATVMEYVNENHKDNVVSETSEIKDANGIVTYETKIKGMDLTFDSEGKFVKSVKN